MHSWEPHPGTPEDASATATVRRAHTIRAEVDHPDLRHARVTASSTDTLPQAPHSGVGLQDPLKPRIPRGKVQPYRRLRKKRRRRLSLTAVIVFAGVFASSYAYLTWSPNEIADLFPKLHAFVAEHIRLPGNGDTSFSDSTYAGEERQTKPIELPPRADARESNQRADGGDQWASTRQWDKPDKLTASDPLEAVLPESHVPAPAQSERFDTGNSRTDVAVLENKPLSPSDVAIEAPAARAAGSATQDSETQQDRLRDPNDPSEERDVAPARREQVRATDSGVVEMGGKRVISDELERALRAHSLKAQRMSDGSVKITLLGAFLADAGRVRLDTEVSQSLEKLAFVLRNYEGFTVQIVAHRDANSTDNRQVEQLRRRAQSIAKHLIDHGVPIQRVSSEARGAHRPTFAMSNSGKRTTQQRAIEIFLKPTA